MKKFYYFDALSIISAFAVIMLHANGVFWSHPTGRLWYSSVIIESVFYFAVPIFFMISGATLIDYRERCTTVDYFKKRFWRAVVPFFCWSLIALLFFTHCNFVNQPAGAAIKTVVRDVINYKYMPYYWFFYPLFAVYLCIPVLAQIQNKIKTFTYMIIYAFLSIVLLSFLIRFFGIKNMNTGALYSPMTGGYLIYPLLGYVFSRVTLPRKWRLLLYAAGIAGTALHIWGTIHYSPPGAPISTLFKGYLNFPAIFQAVALFVFFKEINWEKLPSFLLKIIDFIKPHTLGIYLLHGFFISCIAKNYKAITSSIYYRTFGAAGIFLLCLLITVLISAIPGIRLIMGAGTKKK